MWSTQADELLSLKNVYSGTSVVNEPFKKVLEVYNLILLEYHFINHPCYDPDIRQSTILWVALLHRVSKERNPLRIHRLGKRLPVDTCAIISCRLRLNVVSLFGSPVFWPFSLPGPLVLKTLLNTVFWNQCLWSKTHHLENQRFQAYGYGLKSSHTWHEDSH